MIMAKINFIVNLLSDTFDDFVDDLLSSDVNLLKGELDFLLMQHLFNSIDLKLINKTEIEDSESLAAWFLWNFSMKSSGSQFLVIFYQNLFF